MNDMHTLSRPCVTLKSIPASQNRLLVMFTFSAVDGFRLKNLMLLACKEKDYETMTTRVTAKALPK